MDILAEIKTQYETFGKARRQISDIILENPAKCCFLSLKEFAAAANTTEVTVLKYCRDLGISSFVELKKSLQSYMLTWISPADRTKFITSQSVTQNDLIEKVLQSELEAIKRTFDENSIDRMMEFVSCLRQAKHICIAAHNVSKIPAQYFICRMAAAGLVANQLNLDDKFQIFSGLTSCCPEDTVLVAFCFSPYGKNTIQTAKFCKSLFNISTCMDWRVDFLPCKAKIRRHPDGWQGFLTQSGRKIRRQDMRGGDFKQALRPQVSACSL